MKRFAWRLQRVLDIKEKEEQIKRSELLRVTENLAQKRSELLIQKRILENIINSITEKKTNGCLEEQEYFLKCSTINDERIRELESKVNDLKTQQREEIAEVIKARRFKEGMEKLRMEAQTQFIKEQEKLEQKELDEMATIVFARKIM